MALAQRVADAERRSVTSVFEVALIDYAGRKGIRPNAKVEETKDGTGP